MKIGHYSRFPTLKYLYEDTVHTLPYSHVSTQSHFHDVFHS